MKNKIVHSNVTIGTASRDADLGTKDAELLKIKKGLVLKL